ADWLIDMGPEGGLRGGEVVATGTPEAVAGVQNSHTGKFLREIFERLRYPVRAPAPSFAVAAETRRVGIKS
ncbi:MAG TPA: hypothetical protein VMI31_04870, partial [Fimbriimonadaceae bacterium]|nr:hypothetical protein [Fimbriimonadaceae bacterium]